MARCVQTPDEGRAPGGCEVSDKERPFTEADKAAQAHRTKVLAELEQLLAAREAREQLPTIDPEPRTRRLN
jgi:hypothetical protein